MVKKWISAYYEKLITQSHLGIQSILEIGTTDPNHITEYNQPVVEADESLFTHISDINGVYLSQCYVLGVIDRTSGKFRRVRAVGTDRSTESIRQFFYNNVATILNIQERKTRVFTDGFKKNSFLNSAGYSHHVVVHDNCFGKGIFTTNHIESLWAQIKSDVNFNKGQSYSTIKEVQESLNESC